MDPSLTTVTGRVATIPSDINRLYDTAAAEIHRQNRRVRLDERGLPCPVRLPAGPELVGQGIGERAGHRDLHPLLAGHRPDRGRAEFLTYARQVLDQADLLEERYKHAKPRKQLCQVSTQHYMFAVERSWR